MKEYSPGASMTSDYAYGCDNCNEFDGRLVLRWEDPEFVLCFECLKKLALEHLAPHLKDAIVVRRAVVSESLRNKILVRDKDCRICHAPGPLALDHVIPFSLGGVTEESNLQALCHPCNTKKSARVN